MTTARIAMPDTAAAGEVIEIKTLITHAMETGFRRDALGRAIERNILTHFECRFDGATVINMSLDTGVAANPYIQFFAQVTQSGEFEFRWMGERDFTHVERRKIVVAGR